MGYKVDATFDAIVIGSGISGGWAAKELTEKGLKVLLLERGEDIKHIKDYKTANTNPWEFPHRSGRTQKMIEDYPVLKRDYPLSETNLNFWVKVIPYNFLLSKSRKEPSVFSCRSFCNL